MHFDSDQHLEESKISCVIAFAFALLVVIICTLGWYPELDTGTARICTPEVTANLDLDQPASILRLDYCAEAREDLAEVASGLIIFMVLIVGPSLTLLFSFFISSLLTNTKSSRT